MNMQIEMRSASSQMRSIRAAMSFPGFFAVLEPFERGLLAGAFATVRAGFAVVAAPLARLAAVRVGAGFAVAAGFAVEGAFRAGAARFAAGLGAVARAFAGARLAAGLVSVVGEASAMARSSLAFVSRAQRGEEARGCAARG
jgi:hypothetical protein